MLNEIEFKELYHKNKSTLNRYSLFLTKDYDEAQDLLQDTLVRIWQQRVLYVETGKFLPYAKLVMKRLYIAGLTKPKQRFEQSFTAYGDLKALNSMPLNMSIEKTLDCSDALKQISTIKYFPILYDKYYEGLTEKEISIKYGLSIPIVKRRIFKFKVDFKKNRSVAPY
jgi:RNA polymerase sigma-70 factor (ECF subfamily)